MSARTFTVATISALLVGHAAHAASVENGRQLVQRNCGMCHAAGVSGASKNKSAPRFRDLRGRYPVSALSEALAEGIRTGHPAMPEFRFLPAEVDDILAYLERVQTTKVSAPPG